MFEIAPYVLTIVNGYLNVSPPLSGQLKSDGEREQ
jgi:hypothetical protein